MSYAGMIASAVGGEIQGWASLLDNWAMQNAFQGQEQLQQGYANQALSNFNQNLPKYSASSANTQLANDYSSRMSSYGAADATPLSPTKVKQSGFVPAALNVSNRGAAKVGAYGDWQFGLGQNQLNQQRILNQIVNFAKGQAGVFPYTMYQAQHSNDDLAAVGQAISSLGGGGNSLSSAFNQQPQASGFNGAPGYGNGGGFGNGGVNTDTFDFSGVAAQA